MTHGCSASATCEVPQQRGLAPMSEPKSAGVFCRPGRPQKQGVGLEWGVSDPASRASRSSRTRRAGSLTPRVGGQFVRTNAARMRPDRRPVSCADPRHDRVGVVLAIKLPRCRTVGSRTDGRSTVHTEAARPAETGRRLADRRVHDAAWRLVRQHLADRSAPALAIHQRAVSTSGRHSYQRGKTARHSVSGCGVRGDGQRWCHRRGHR